MMELLFIVQVSLVTEEKLPFQQLHPIQLYNNFLKERKQFSLVVPEIEYEIDLPPFIFLKSFWLGLFPLSLSVPMEPFHTIFNVLKAHTEFLSQKNLFQEEKWKEFIKFANNDKKEKKKLGLDFNFWHGDQFFQIIKKKEFMLKYVDAVLPEWQQFTQKFLVLVSVIRYANAEEIERFQIHQKLVELWENPQRDYKYFMKGKITQHQLHHLLHSIAYLGSCDNFNGGHHEKKHKKIGRKGVRFFLGGSVPLQVCNFETMRENFKLGMKETFQRHYPHFEVENTLKLIPEWTPHPNVVPQSQNPSL